VDRSDASSSRRRSNSRGDVGGSESNVPTLSSAGNFVSLCKVVYAEAPAGPCFGTLAGDPSDRVGSFGDDPLAGWPPSAAQTRTRVLCKFALKYQQSETRITGSNRGEGIVRMSVNAHMDKK
jgi:hypothetical protein